MGRPTMTTQDHFVKRFACNLMRLCFLFNLLFFTTPAQAQVMEKNAFEFSLNELHFVIDKTTGSILSLSSPKVGVFLEASPERAGIIDMAFPIEEFQPLRLASKYSKGVKIDAGNQSVTLSWEALGACRPLPVSGKVSALVRFAAAADSESVILSCTIKVLCPCIRLDSFAIIEEARTCPTYFRRLLPFAPSGLSSGSRLLCRGSEYVFHL